MSPGLGALRVSWVWPYGIAARGHGRRYNVFERSRFRGSFFYKSLRYPKKRPESIPSKSTLFVGQNPPKLMNILAQQRARNPYSGGG